jgi:hypothetical protein
MIPARYNDKDSIVKILVEAFDNNKSVNYIVKQDSKRKKRIQHLMEYSFEVCFKSGKVYLSDEKQGCALLVFPEKKRTTIRTIYQDTKLILLCTGISGIRKVIRRENKIKTLQPKGCVCYLWFIGVSQNFQDGGIGSGLLREIIEECASDDRIICLETSTERNIPWYQKFGFTIYNELDFGYKLFFLKRD